MTDTDLIAEAITEQYGERCPDFEPECYCCKAWAQYDALASSSASGAAWRPIQTVPMDETVILANFTNRCLLTGAPHVWTATYVTKWQNLAGADAEGDPQWCECSFAAMNENGEPTHWMPLPTPPQADGGSA